MLAATPGATTAVVVRSTIARGTRGGLLAACGAATGNSLQAVIAVLGMAFVLHRWPAALTVVQMAGAAFLLWLGATSLWRAAAFARAPLQATAHAARDTSFRDGLFVNLLNPSITTFYIAVVPAFVPAGAPVWYFAALSAAHVVIAIVCHVCWAFAFGRLRAVATRPIVARSLDALAGLVLIALAVQVLRS